MTRRNLVTKEKVKKPAEGKLKNWEEEDWEDYQGSINDDLERFSINLQNHHFKKKGIRYQFLYTEIVKRRIEAR